MQQEKDKKSIVAQTEEKILSFWEKNDIFKKSLEQRNNSTDFSFYDGPPFANGQPHFGHSLVTSIKDSICRYKTMRGYRVDRKNGWDCHGLPVEFAIEKKFGVSGKKQILELGLDKFNAACRESVFQYKNEWESFFNRIGRWVDVKQSYATIDREYTESVWWVLKQIHDKGLLYKSYKSMPYCPRCETPLSNFEVNEGYQDDVDDPSLYVKFKLQDEGAYLLAWTTTPWSLPGNSAIAVHPQELYVYVDVKNKDGQVERLIVAKNRLSEVFKEGEYKVVKEAKGSLLAGKPYVPLFKVKMTPPILKKKNLYKVVPSDVVDVGDGTGVLHVAPAFGEADLDMGEQLDFPVLLTVNPSGHLQGIIDYPEINGIFFKRADKLIIKRLNENNLVFFSGTAKHTYPFCYRCESPLLYYAISTWFIKVPDIKQSLIKNAKNIKWVPDHIKEGRFGKWLEGAREWAVSRNRYWGSPMPIWVNEKDDSDYIVIGSVRELEHLANCQDGSIEDLHRPYIDEIVIRKDGKRYIRIEEVLDCWFESGSMPVAQQHYPFENKEKFEMTFPADYVGEALDQTRLWLYVLHVVSTILFDKPAYKNVLVNGLVMAEDGQKLSKRLKNYPAIDDVFANEGADALRLYLLSNYQALDAGYMRISRESMKDVSRNVIGTLSNSFRFFKTYADIDKWKPGKKVVEPKSVNVLDRWILARLNQTIDVVTKEADSYRLAHAINPVFGIIDDLSNWYIRRSRRRFWKSEDDRDKHDAYNTLHYCLVRISQILCPWAPFISESIWVELTKDTDEPLSVHLSDWPKSGTKFNKKIIDEMSLVRSYIVEGLSQRAEAKIKIRQPLKELKVNATTNLESAYLNIIKDEVNVKSIIIDNKIATVELNTTIDEKLKLEGLTRDVIRHVQETRKKAGLNVEDRISLELRTDDIVLKKAITEHINDINSETLALSNSVKNGSQEYSVKIEDRHLLIKLSKIT